MLPISGRWVQGQLFYLEILELLLDLPTDAREVLSQIALYQSPSLNSWPGGRYSLPPIVLTGSV